LAPRYFERPSRFFTQQKLLYSAFSGDLFLGKCSLRAARGEIQVLLLVCDGEAITNEIIPVFFRLTYPRPCCSIHSRGGLARDFARRAARPAGILGFAPAAARE
jgi:hypothetical protein